MLYNAEATSCRFLGNINKPPFTTSSFLYSTALRPVILSFQQTASKLARFTQGSIPFPPAELGTVILALNCLQRGFDYATRTTTPGSSEGRDLWSVRCGVQLI